MIGSNEIDVCKRKSIIFIIKWQRKRQRNEEVNKEKEMKVK